MQEDLQRHRITQEQWDNWSSDQRQQVVNFRARMGAAGLWNDVDGGMFVSINSDGKTTKATVEPEAWKNFLLAFTIKKSALDQGDYFDNFRRKLDNAGITRDTFFKHREAEWSNHEGGSGISIHLLGFKPHRMPLVRSTLMLTEGTGGIQATSSMLGGAEDQPKMTSLAG